MDREAEVPRTVGTGAQDGLEEAKLGRSALKKTIT